MVRADYLAMKTDLAASRLIESDINELQIAAGKLLNDAAKLGGLGFGTSFFKWLASFAAIYLLILDRTNWRTNMLTALLVPYIFFSLPTGLFHFLRYNILDIFILCLQLLWENMVGVIVCLAVGCYLLQEHIRASGGFRNSFTQSNGISNTLGIILLIIYPIWALVINFT